MAGRRAQAPALEHLMPTDGLGVIGFLTLSHDVGPAVRVVCATRPLPRAKTPAKSCFASS